MSRVSKPRLASECVLALALALAFDGALAGAASIEASGEEQQLQAIRNAYLANRETFGFGLARFRLIFGYADNATDAREGRIDRPIATDGVYVWDAPKARYECVYDVPTMVASRRRTGENSWSSPIGSERYLTNGRVTLWDLVDVATDDQTVTHSAQISAGVNIMYRNIIFPLTLNAPEEQLNQGSLPMVIDHVLRGDPGWSLERIDTKSELDGRSLVEVTMRSPGNVQRFWVDMDRGAIPVREDYVMPLEDREDPDSQHFDDDLRPGPGGGWIPFRVTSFMQGGLVWQLVIQSADFETRPDPSEFRMEFPEPTRMVNAASMVRYSAMKTWDLDHLPTAGSPGTERITMGVPDVAPPAMPGERPGPRRWVLALVVAGGLLTAFGVVMLLRRWKNGGA